MNLREFLGTVSAEQRKRFCEHAGTTRTHLYQLLGGHRLPSVRMLDCLIRASKLIHPKESQQWLTIEEVHTELMRARRRRDRRKGETA